MPPKKTSTHAFSTPIRKTYRAVRARQGAVFPIVESVGRRVIRQIDPASKEGRNLLEKGKVTLMNGERHAALRFGEPGDLSPRGTTVRPRRGPRAES